MLSFSVGINGLLFVVIFHFTWLFLMLFTLVASFYFFGSITFGLWLCFLFGTILFEKRKKIVMYLGSSSLLFTFNYVKIS